MRVLVACEYSGVVRDAFRWAGHDAWSCDVLPTDVPGPHIQGDVRDVLSDGWDLMVAHPPCTYLTNSGVRWLYSEPDRIEKMHQAADFFSAIQRAPIPRIAIENPIMHGRARRLAACGPATQIIQPWMFGHGETKATCLWLKGLPALHSMHVVPGRVARVHRLPPTLDRWKLRSTTPRGIGLAMALQWGGTVKGCQIIWNYS